MTLLEFETPTLNEKGEVVARTRHSAEQFTEDLGNGPGLDLIAVPAGMFRMGSLPNTGGPDEYPQHFVTIKSFRLGKFLITQGQWKAIMGKLPPCRFKGDRLPVERVAWEDAQRFCQRLSQKTGRAYSLPSETQWEYACRAGTTSAFSFGETITSDVVNFNGEHSFRAEPHGRYIHVTTEGGTFPPNAFGLYDMHGNLWEWCTDNWLDDYRSSPRDDSSYQNKDSYYRVARGGSWHEPPGLCRSASRMKFLQSDAEDFIGLRVASEVT